MSNDKTFILAGAEAAAHGRKMLLDAVLNRHLKNQPHKLVLTENDMYELTFNSGTGSTDLTFSDIVSDFVGRPYNIKNANVSDFRLAMYRDFDFSEPTVVENYLLSEVNGEEDSLIFWLAVPLDEVDSSKIPTTQYVLATLINEGILPYGKYQISAGD